MGKGLTGLRIRTLRKDAGLTQAELARRAGVSASYLNLIELNKRSIPGELLERIAEGLQVDSTALRGELERRIAESLNEIAADPTLRDPADTPEASEDLVGRNPRWARLMVRLYQAYRDNEQAVLALADRLNRDPFLGNSVHTVLTNVTSIQSAAEILSLGDSLEEQDKERFLSIIAADSERLSATARSLAGFFDSAQVRIRSATPMEHVDAFITESDNHFPTLEAVAEDFRASVLPGETPVAAAMRLQGAEMPPGADLRGPRSLRFARLKGAASALGAEAISGILAAHPAILASPDAKEVAAGALRSYLAGAILMPYEAFLEACERHRYDLDHLTALFDVSYEQAAHRVATLRRKGAEGVRFAFMRSDPSGYVTKRLPLPRLPLPRYGHACPLWPVYGAFQSPGATMRSFGTLPAGDEFLFFARAVEKRLPRPGHPRDLLSVMLACEASEASRIVYGDGLDRASAAVPVGTVCRLCPRAECGQRQEPPLLF